METIDLKAFRKVNNLTQIELGEYLGVQKAFISSIENGRNKLPKAKLTLLLQNPHGWDVSMLPQFRAASGVAQDITQPQENALVAELRAQIERLERKVDDLNRELGEKEAILKFLSQKVGEPAPSAEVSLSANVG